MASSLFRFRSPVRRGGPDSPAGELEHAVGLGGLLGKA